MNMKKKPIIQVLLSVLLVAVITVGGTLAYLVASDHPVINSFTFANVNTDIEEDPDGGDPDAKEPTIKNNGESTVFVRAKVIVATADGSSVPVTEEDLTVDYNTDGWKNQEGWYYYLGKLEKGESTTPLFNGVTVAPDLESTAKFDVIVYQESVLAGNYESAFDAFNPSTSE